jgi:hypothetical protein
MKHDFNKRHISENRTAIMPLSQYLDLALFGFSQPTQL